MGRDSVIALAFLKVNWESRGEDYLDNFVPLVAEVILRSDLEVVSLPTVQEGLLSRFGMRMPSHALENVLQRVKRAGMLRQDHGVLYPVPERLQSTQFEVLQKELEGTYERVVGAIKSHARAQFDLEWDAQVAEAALLNLLVADGASLLFASYEGTTFELQQEGSQAEYVVGSLISAAQVDDPELFSDFEALAKGQILATALFLPRPGQVQRRFKNTTVFFDTSFLLYVAGYAGPYLEAPAVNLVELLHHYGAKLRYFPGTMDEMRGILDANAAMLRKGRTRFAYGATMEHFMNIGATSSDVDLYAARLPEKLRFRRIEPKEPPTYEEHRYVVDEPGLEEFLQKEIGYRNDDARVHDVDCIAAMARFRRGRSSFELETSGAVFVTTNSELARSCRRFFQPEATYGTVPLCLTDRTVASLMWLKGPTEAPELPRRLLIANAYAATQPTEELWKRYLTEIARLEEKGDISENDYALLRYSTVAKKAVMDLTQGDPDAFSLGTVQEVLRRAEANVREGLEVQLANEQATREALEEKVRDQGSELKRIERNESLKREIQGERIALLARRIANVAIWAPRVAVWIMLMVGLVMTFPWSLPEVSAAWIRYAGSGVLLILLIVQFAGAGFGLSVDDMMNRWEERLSSWIESRLRSLIVIEPQVLVLPANGGAGGDGREEPGEAAGTERTTGGNDA